jgi:hypothetical protein
MPSAKRQTASEKRRKRSGTPNDLIRPLINRHYPESRAMSALPPKTALLVAFSVVDHGSCAAPLMRRSPTQGFQPRWVDERGSS